MNHSHFKVTNIKPKYRKCSLCGSFCKVTGVTAHFASEDLVMEATIRCSRCITKEDGAEQILADGSLTYQAPFLSSYHETKEIRLP